MPRAEPESRLYRAYSIGDLTRDGNVFYDVRIDWYCLEREAPPLPYEEVIAGYGALSEALRSRLEKDVARCFTGKEVSDLDALLSQKYGMGISREEVRVPLKDRILFFEEGNTVIYDFLELSEKEGYSLPFKVWGYYSLRNSFNSNSRDNGARFLRRALELLNLEPGVSDTQLARVAKALHDEEKLIVERRVEA